LQQSSGKEDAPIGTPPRPDRTEPSFEEALGSNVYFPAVGKYLTEKARRSVNGFETYRDTPKTDNLPADAKGETRGTAGAPARRMPRCPFVEVGLGAVGTGGRVLAESLRTPVKRDCGAGVVGGGGV
jgi:hypothetical protein